MRFTAVVVLPILIAGAQAAANWSQSCSGQEISGNFLIANCINSSGLTNQSQLDLNACLVNVHGLLDCGANLAPQSTSNGQAMKTCNDCSVSGNAIYCSCLEGSSGVRNRGAVDSDRCIGNRNGSLWC